MLAQRRALLEREQHLHAQLAVSGNAQRHRLPSALAFRGDSAIDAHRGALGDAPIARASTPRPARRDLWLRVLQVDVLILVHIGDEHLTVAVRGAEEGRIFAIAAFDHQPLGANLGLALMAHDLQGQLGIGARDLLRLQSKVWRRKLALAKCAPSSGEELARLKKLAEQVFSSLPVKRRPSHVGIGVAFGPGSGRRERRKPIPAGLTTASRLSTPLRPPPGAKPKDSFVIGSIREIVVESGSSGGVVDWYE